MSKLKLWEKGYQLDTLVEQFTVGDDPTLDQQLIVYDCLGSMAHAAMLHKIGILEPAELHALLAGLNSILEQARNNQFVIDQAQEDVHTAIENALTDSLGVVGKKLHTSRSRNDQILVDTRLYTKDKIQELFALAIDLISSLVTFAEQHKHTPIPGRTHMQRAMPSSLGLWAGAMAESLLDSLEILQQAYKVNDQCPLGSAASYGSSLPIDRAYTAKLLGFSKVQNNVLYANNSRGKIEAAAVHGLAQIMADLSKMAADLMFYSLPEVAYLSLSADICSGSSLMPQKHNPCALELIRAKAATINSLLLQLLEIIRPLPSGYHRDFQETKRPLLQAFGISLGAVATMQRVLDGVTVNKENCLNAFSSELFATDKVLQLTTEGIPFREAYQQVAGELDQVKMPDPIANIIAKKHIGATGNLGLALIEKKTQTHTAWLTKQQEQWQAVIQALGQGEVQ